MKSILIIDPDRNLFKELYKSLKPSGYKIFHSDKFMTGLDKAIQKKPNIILTEIEFFEQEGYEIIRKIRSDKTLMKIPIIVISNKGDEFSKVLAFEYGADDYVVKPISMVELKARINAKLKYIS